MAEKIYLDWNDPEGRVWWSGGPPGTIDFIWSEVYILIEVGNAIGTAGGYIPEQDPWEWLERKVDKKVADQFRKIVIRVNGLEKTRDRDKEPVVTAYHIKNTLNQFGIKVNVEVSPLRQRRDDIEVKLQPPPGNIFKKNISVSVDFEKPSSTQSDI